jgi:hypothetical protein
MKGLPVTALLAPEIGAATTDGDRAAKSGSVSKLTVATPEVTVEAVSVTKALPFHTITTLDEVMDDDRMVTVSG